MKTERDYCYFISLAESLQKASNIAVAFIWQEFEIEDDSHITEQRDVQMRFLVIRLLLNQRYNKSVY